MVLQIEDGTLKSRTNQESSWKFKMAAPSNVCHIGKQPTTLNKGPGISLTDFHGLLNHARVTQKCYTTSKWLLSDCGPKQQKSIQQAAMMKTEWPGSEWSLDSVLQSMAERQRLREPIRSWHGNDISRNLKWATQSPSLKESIKPNNTHCQI